MLYNSKKFEPTKENPQGTQQTIKPNAPLIGANGNIFNLIGIASHALHDAGMQEKADRMFQRIIISGSYEEALHIIRDYVNFTEAKGQEPSESEDSNTR